ncbi:hypothetical protein FI667_g16575, partial [Globisporangium splendens]
MPHLEYESHKELLQKLRLHVPWLQDLSYQELRILASKAEYAMYEQGDAVIENGLFKIDNISRTGGLLLLGYGRAELLGKSNPDQPSDDKGTLLQLRIWKPNEPILSTAVCPLEDAFYNPPGQVQPRRESAVDERRPHGDGRPSSPPPRVVQPQEQLCDAAAAISTLSDRADLCPGADDEEHNLENADMEDLNDPAQKWRRKKRNKNLLEKTILETQQNSDLVNALIMYVLSSANRGDIHVVHNIAIVGGILSDADIELNDRYVSPQQAVIQHREGRFWLYDTASEWGTFVRLEENQCIQVYPDDVFNAGEVEFTCLAAFPVRKKTQICCIQ